MTYLFPTILAVYIVLGIFSIELQSEKQMHMKKVYKLYDHIAYSPKLACFCNFLARTAISHFFSPVWFKTVSRKLVLELKL